MLNVIRYYIGIDIGLSGGIVCLDTLSNTLRSLPMPTLSSYKGSGSKRKKVRSIDLSGLADIFRCYPVDNTKVIIENVWSRPNQGVVSVFNFGYQKGAIESCLTTLRLDYEYITPQEWKKYWQLIGQPKKASNLKAIEVFPKCENAFKMVKQNGQAEAALIMAHGNLEYVEKHGQDTVSVV